jgi:DNA-binding helix-hairpin-helix protein with protein kinase domain
VFWVNDVDAMYRRALAAGFAPEAAPADASWASAISTSATTLREPVRHPKCGLGGIFAPRCTSTHRDHHRAVV